MDKRLLAIALLGVGAYLIFRKQYSASALGALPEEHREEALEDIAAMQRLVTETEAEVRAGRCREALATAGKSAVAAGKVERNLEYAGKAFEARYSKLNGRRMRSRDAFAVRCMR